MARTFSRNKQTYPAGTYGPFSVDSFTRDNATRLVATMTVDAWPNMSPLMVVELAWDTGGVARFDVSGEQRDENGQLLPSVSFEFAIPRSGGVRKAVSGGSVKVTTFAPISTAISLTAA